MKSAQARQPAAILGGAREMSTVINRTTLELRERVSILIFTEPVWKAIHTKTIGDQTEVERIRAILPRYRKIDASDNVVELSQAEKDIVDAAILANNRDNVANQMDSTEDILRAFALTLLDELNNHALTINAILDAIDNASNLAGVKTAVAAIPDYPQRSIANLKTAIRGKLGT